MRISNSIIDISYESQENIAKVIVIENPKVFYQMGEELEHLMLNEECSWIASENDGTKLSPSKIDVIYTPFNIELNSKKILNKIYKDIDDEINQNLFSDKELITSSILKLVETASQNLFYNLEYNFECDFKDILKTFQVKLACECTGLLEKLVEYVKISNEVCGIECIFFINLKNYLDTEELRMLYKEAFYNKITLVLLEFNQAEQLDCEHTVLIDKDLCLIEF